MTRMIAAMCVAMVAADAFAEDAPEVKVERIPGARPLNVVFILSDDHRFDAMGFMGHPFLKTPEMDRMAKEGIHFKNAFVTTSLCSPSRASILTGLYMHHHRVVDNNERIRKGTVFFPQYLQQAGYQTAFIGKWHMGGSTDEPRKGFDHWVSFRGQGRYYPRRNWSLNVNGKRVPQKGYITDELTDYAINWLNDTKKKESPFFLYLSHKAVHAEFAPAKRHEKLYDGVKIKPPATQANTAANYKGKPRWVKDQRNSWHGVDFPYHSDLNVKEYYRQYLRTLGGVDDSIGRVRKWLKDNGKEKNTLILYMGDNGFLFGEHGLIDKRCSYEESIRVPMLGVCPGRFKAGTVIESMVANIDVGPSILAAAGLKTPAHMDGQSFLDLAAGDMKKSEWRKEFLYEYYWEWNFPQTPTQFALRTDDYKLIVYHGIWDVDELYDIKNDPKETKNLIFDPKHRNRIQALRRRLYEKIKASGGAQVPFGFKRSMGQNLRRLSGSKASEFPPQLMRKKNGME